MTGKGEAMPRPEQLLEIIRVQTEIARQGLDLGGVMALVAARAHQLTGATGAVVELMEGDEMVYRAASGSAEASLGLRMKRGGSLSGMCIEAGAPLSCEDSDTDPRVNREACRQVGLRSMVVAPLKHLDSIVGVIKILSTEPRAFGQSEAKALELMSELIAAAMFHATKYASDEMFNRASQDDLTGLANRAFFYDRLRQRIAQAERTGESFGLLNFDMDGLKPINDGLGHRAGDAALRAVAERMQRMARQSDTVARVGGDEFGVILYAAGTREAVARAAGRIEASIVAPYEFEGTPLTLGASIGSALYPVDGRSLEPLIEAADQAMYQVKRSRKSR